MAEKLTTSEVAKRITNMENGEYRLTSAYLTSKDPITIIHIPCGNEISIKAKSFLNEGNGRCKICNPIQASTNRKGVDEAEFIKRVLEKTGTEYSYVSGFISFKRPTENKVLMKHNTCGHQWEVNAYTFDQGSRCPVCANSKRGEYSKVDNYLDTVLESQEYGNEYVWIDKDYDHDNKKKLSIIHKICNNIYTVRPNDFQQGYKCPKCFPSFVKTSAGAKLIEEILLENNINFNKETSYEGLRHINPLFFDFDIDLPDETKLIIEFDGAFHSNDVKLINKKNSLSNTQARDKAKNDFCAQYPGYFHLHRIGYKQDVEVELYKLLRQYKLIK